MDEAAPHTSHPLGQTLAGGLVLALGLVVIAGWWLHIAPLLQLLPNLSAVAWLSAWCFVLAGLALALPGLWPRYGTRLRWTLGAALLVLAVLHLLYLLFDWPTGVEGHAVQAWFNHDNPRPAQTSAPATVSFLFVALTLLLTPLREHLAVETAGRGAVLAVLTVSAVALLGYLFQIEDLYSRYAFGNMPIHTALGLLILGIGLVPYWWPGATEWFAHTEDRGVTSIAVVVLVCTALGVGLTTWVTEQQHLTTVLGDGLRLALKSRIEQIDTALDLRLTRATALAGSAPLRDDVRKLLDKPGDRAAREHVQALLSGYQPFGFSAIVVLRPDGSELLRIGELLPETARTLPLTQPDHELVWHDGLFMRSRLPLGDDGSALGSVVIEQVLSELTTAFAHLDDNDRGDQLLLCGGTGEVRCLASGDVASQFLALPADAADRTRLTQPALQGGSGVSSLRDYRGRYEVGAYGPVAGSGLAAILKSDTAHLYRPLTEQLRRVLFLILALIGAGAALIYVRVRPLARALQLGEKRLQLALEASASYVWDLDLRAGLLTPDQRFKDYLGLDEPGAISLERWREHVHPDDLEQEAFARSDWTVHKGTGVELRLRNRRGEYRWFSFRGGVVSSDSTGRPLRALGTARDVNERKRVDQELIAARIAAEDANHAKSQFLSSMSHELRTPLNGVLGYVQMLLADPTTPSSQQRQLSAIESCGHHLLTLINDVLDLAKIESGNLEVTTGDCNLYELLESVSDIIRERAVNKRLRYSVDIEKTVPNFIRTDAIKLRQILVNLLGNAIKFTSSGSVVLRVTARPGGRELLFQVRDTGIGIPLEQQQEIFKPFRQIDRASGGTGLGLSISQRLCEALGGKLLVHSTVGAGSSFSFSLPFEPGEATRVEPAERLTHPVLDLRGRRLTVMVVDDNPINRQVLAGMLRASGIDIVEAEHGREAIEKLRIQLVPLVLMDVRMPVMDGFAATRAIKNNPLLRSTTVIAVSASVFPDTIANMRAAGCDDFIKKPVRVRELLEKIALHLKLTLREESNDHSSKLPQ